MPYSLRNIVILLITTLLLACANEPEIKKVPDSSAQKLYQQAQETLANGLFDKAIQLLEAIDSRYPFGPISRQVQLDLIYAYYKSGRSAKAIANIDRFVRLNPNHPDLDYVVYMRGLVNMSADENLFQEAFGIDRADRDITFTRDAFKDFKKLLEEYPNSKYGSDSRKRMTFLLNKLARHEIKVAEYYINRGAYLAAANRAKYIVEYYSQSVSVESALEMMVYCYGELGLFELQEDAEKTLHLNRKQS